MGILKQEKLPYLLVILLSTIAWIFTHIVDRISSSPYLYYSVDKTDGFGEYSLTYTVKNISRDRLIEDVEFLLIPDHRDNIQILSHGYQIIAPMKRGAGDIEEYTPDYFKYSLARLQPKCTFVMTIVINKNFILPLRISSKSPVILTEANMYTFFVDYELCILACVGALILAFIFWYVKLVL